MNEIAYESLTLTERAERHVLAARHLLSNAQAQAHQLNSPLAADPQTQAVLLAAAQAFWTGAQAEAALANACALLAANAGTPNPVSKLDLPPN